MLEGGRYAGGLVGYISGTRTIYVEHSYADSYLYASGTTGGLIGSCIGTADITLRDCYTAGFQEADVMAGLVLRRRHRHLLQRQRPAERQ